MNTTINYRATCEKARLLMRNIQKASEGPRKKTGAALIAEAMEQTRFLLTRKHPEPDEQYWRKHPEDLAADLVDLLLSVTTQDSIDELVNKIIDLYRKEDYDYVVSLAREGKRPQGLNSLSDRLYFIEVNQLNTRNLDRDNLVIVAETSRARIERIEERIWDEHCPEHLKIEERTKEELV